MTTTRDIPAPPSSRIASLPPRPDLYGAVHKGLRAFLCTTLLRVGDTDPGDERAILRLAAEVEELLSLCEQHLREEDAFIEPLLSSRVARAEGGTGGEHREHQAAIDALRRALSSVLTAEPNRRAAQLSRLYLSLSLFVAENLEHMHREEVDNNRALWATCTDDELQAAEQALVAQIPPEKMRLFVGWMLAGMNHRERVAFLDEMRRGAPREVFEGALALSASRLPRSAHEALLAALGVA